MGQHIDNKFGFNTAQLILFGSRLLGSLQKPWANEELELLGYLYLHHNPADNLLNQSLLHHPFESDNLKRLWKFCDCWVRNTLNNMCELELAYLVVWNLSFGETDRRLSRDKGWTIFQKSMVQDFGLFSRFLLHRNGCYVDGLLSEFR